ncbi:MAG: hypothetical protein PHN31_05830 [Candidatus Gracilibacteria bacterium]|nr:hypothetical protein [Candidatus Gracilibacteria bacterium]
MKKDIYSKLFKENGIDIIETNKLVEFISTGIGTVDADQRTKTATSLIQVKAIRAQTDAINKNSKSSTFLARVGILVGGVGLLATIIFGILPLIEKIK